MAHALQPAPIAKPVHYERRRPEETTLYQLVQEHIETFLAEVTAHTGASLPEFVKDEFDAFLQCGILAHGFLRVRCPECAHEKLVAFSCKRRGFCPSCGARRMVESAAHLVERVIPRVAARQWVLSFPIPLRVLFAAHPELLSSVLQIIHRVIATFLIKQAGVKRQDAGTGAVTLIQRFGSAANLNIHLHCLVLDGVYRISEGEVLFQEARAPTPAELQGLLVKIITRILRLLTRQGHLIEEQGMTYLAEADGNRALTPLQAASCSYRIAFGPRAGQKVLSLQSISHHGEGATPTLCANLHGFSLHAAVRCGAHQRKELERLCRYLTRPAIANERLKRNRAGQVVLQLKSAYRDGTTHIVLSPPEFMQRLAALVPRPRLHLIRFHGVLAPNAKWRSGIVPSPAENTSEHAADHTHAQHSPARMSWARLLKRVFDLDIEHCPQCGGRMKIIAAIEDAAVIAKILTHLGLPARAPPRTPARRFDLFPTP
jgi:Putative transposase/Transposase zinc-binding domain